MVLLDADTFTQQQIRQSANKALRSADNTVSKEIKEELARVGGKVDDVVEKLGRENANKLWTKIDEYDGIFNNKMVTYYDVNVTYQSERVRAGVAIYDSQNDLLEFHLNIPRELQQQGIGNEVFKRAIEDYTPSKIKGWWKKWIFIPKESLLI